MEENDKEFGLVQPFYIDDGELNGFDPQQCFVLGYEFCRIVELAKKGEPFEQQFHSDNEARVRKMLNDQKVTGYEIHTHDDWPLLVVRAG